MFHFIYINSTAEESTDLQLERIKRLRVNRIALMQMLRVEHILPYLLQNKILTVQDKEKILANKTDANN